MTVYKAMYLAKRHPALDLDDFPQRWRQHSALAGSLAGLRGFFTGARQCSRLAGSDFPADASIEFDGVALVGLRDLASATTIWEQPETRDIMQPDELRVFSRPVVETWLAVEEELLFAGPPGSIGVFGFRRARAGLGAEAFRAHLRGRVAPIERAGDDATLLTRQLHDHVLQAPSPEFGFDVITESWFANLETARRYHADSARQRALLEAYAACCDGGGFALTTHVTFSKGSVGHT